MLAVCLGVALASGACSSGQDSSSTSAAQTDGTISVNKTNEDAGPPQAGGKLAFGLSAETDGWDPSSNRWGSSGLIVGFSVFDPLAAYGEDLEIHPYLASSLSHNDSFTEWTIGVRNGVTFHDGTPVDAEAIAGQLTRNKASLLGSAALTFADTFEPSPDGSQVVATMNKPWSTFPELLASQLGVIASPSAATDPEASANPIGSGPFIFQSWEPNSGLEVKKNPDYWQEGLPHLDNVEFQIVSDVQSRSTSLDSGSIDIFETADPRQILEYTDRAAEDGGPQIFTTQTAESTKIVVALNLAAAPFDDILARQTVAHALDTESLSQRVFEGVFPSVDGLFSKNSPFYAPNHGYPTFDEEAAQRLADEYAAKHGQPLTFTLAVSPTAESALLGQAIQAQMATVGVDVTIVQKEQATMIADTVLGSYQATTFTVFNAPTLDLEYVFVAGPAKGVGELSLNFTRISDEENAAVREAMDNARATDDAETRRREYATVQEEMAKNLNMLFLVQATGALVFAPDVHGVLRYEIPDEAGEPGPPGLPRAVPFTANIWLEGQ